MADQQANASEGAKDATPHADEARLAHEVQRSLAGWIINDTEQDDLANAHDETLPLPVILLHLYRDLARFYERRLGMSQSRVMLLHELMHTGEISQTRLAHRLGIETALLTRFAKQMEASGLLSRRVDPQDNRFTLVTLTPAGQQVFQEMMIFSREFEARLVAGFSEDEQTATKQALRYIQAQLSSMKSSGNETIL